MSTLKPKQSTDTLELIERERSKILKNIRERELSIKQASEKKMLLNHSSLKSSQINRTRDQTLHHYSSKEQTEFQKVERSKMRPQSNMN